ncbi:AraC family transcriptional regulator [Bacillus haikouensis]|uniref:AraC family transcriptional regulator n=1 Tax=Bacillus haikouensis TaxID=1510468 RepID=UPI001553840A|nr:helix-turn-helix domain-containing protein [Bacillus haikouensis]NQD65631.1 AraC family transcriptional regulator [Bacillus haikouensis]
MNYDKLQLNQVNKVVEYIHEHTNDNLSLEQLAKVSTYSPFHFQRMFKGIIGETPAGYVKRIRLENAAHLLIYESNLTITQIALHCGFSSLSYFTYSFQTYFHTSPKKWRDGGYLERFPREYLNSKKSKQVSTKTKESSLRSDYNGFQWLDLSKVKIVHFPDCSTINRFHIGSYVEGVTETWADLFRWADARNMTEASPLIFGEPKSNPYITTPEKSRYGCRIAVPGNWKGLDEEETLYSFKGGKHVVYEFEEPVDYEERIRLIECYSELYSYWLPKSGYRYLGNPIELVKLVKAEGTFDLRCTIKAIALAIEPN